MRSEKIPMLGKRFGRVTVTAELPKRRVRYLCDCGTVGETRAQSLRREEQRSCGCLQREQVRIRSTKHGQHATPIYNAWHDMIARCGNPRHGSYPGYGGRGITVCDRWRDFSAFLADMGHRPSPTHSVERIDNDGPYSPENCRWATPSEQQRNKRTTLFVEYRGETQCIAEWAERVGIRRDILWHRLRSGWGVERAFTQPVLARKECAS